MKHASDHATMLRLILGAVGVASISTAACAGCGSVVIDGVSSGSGTAGSGAVGGGGATSGAGTAGSNAGSGGASGNSGVTVGGGAGAGGGTGCPAPVSSVPVDMPQNGPCSVGYEAEYICFSLPKPPATCEDLYPKACVLDAYSCGYQTYGDEACGPDLANPDACCYTVVGDCPIGRPFLVHGRARLGTVVSGDSGADRSWADRMEPDVSALDRETRRALADFWGQEALFEHASVASFARFVLHLLAVGAPADLVQRAQLALGEEIEHATLGFGLASAYAGAALRPSALDVSGGLDEGFEAAGIAVAVAREGCIAETVAALQIAAARDAATDPVIKSALARVAEQEMEHALLSWRYLRWALEHGEVSLQAAVTAVFTAPEAHVGIGATTALPGDREAMRGHGCLPPDERRALAADTLARVVLPAARALLAAVGSRAREAGSAMPWAEVNAMPGAAA